MTVTGRESLCESWAHLIGLKPFIDPFRFIGGFLLMGEVDCAIVNRGLFHSMATLHEG